MTSQAEIIYEELEDINENSEAFLQKDFSDRLYELLELIKNKPEEIDTILHIIEKERENNNFCPKCGLPLITKEIVKDKNNHKDNKYTEPTYIQYCENCGWTDNN